MTTKLNISFEFFPPKTAKAVAQLWEAIDRLAPLAPTFASVTYGAGGTTRDRSDEVVRGLLQRRETEPAAHLTCVSAPRASVDAQARAWAEAGVRRVVALRGDMPEVGAPFQPHPEGYRNAADLVGGLKRIADFDISVAAYPESHPDSPSPEADLDNLKRKFDAGADRALTQYFFDAEVFLRFRDRARRAGIEAPIVPGIMPVFNFKRMVEFSGRCGAKVPAWMHERFEGLDNDPETRSLVAATTATELCRKLIAEGVDSFHFYTLNRSALTNAVCRMLGVRRDLEEAA